MVPTLSWKFSLASLAIFPLSGAIVRATAIVVAALVLLVPFLVIDSRFLRKFFEVFFSLINILLFYFFELLFVNFDALNPFRYVITKTFSMNQGVKFLLIAAMFCPGYLPVNIYIEVPIGYWYVPVIQWHLCQFSYVTCRFVCILSPKGVYNSYN